MSEKVMPNASDSHFSKLGTIRKNSGQPDTIGLSDSEITYFLSLDPKLAIAIDQASDYHVHLREELDRAEKRKNTEEILNFIRGLKND